MNIEYLFENASEKFPEKIAISKGDEKISFSELQKQVSETAAYFSARGIGKGDRVLIFVPMGIDLYRIVLALFKIGAVAVFLDEWVSKERMEICCKLAQCKGFIGILKAKLFSFFSAELRKIPVKLKLKGKLENTELLLPVNCNANDTALITFTTGSTGIPKAADRTHGFLSEQFKALNDTIHPHATDVDMPVLPIVLLMNLGCGCTSVIADFKSSKPQKMRPEIIFKEILKNKVNRITASPYFIKRLAEFCSAENKNTQSIKKIFTGGAPVFPSEAKVFVKAFPKTLIEIVYGSTEAEPISHIYANELVEEKIEKALPVGKIYFNAEVRIIKISEAPLDISNADHFRELVLEAGNVGEIIVSGDHVLKKYFNNEEAFRQNKIVSGSKTWHRTGDSGFIGEDGKLFLTGRCSAVFEQNGVKVFPFIAEDLLKQIDGVQAGTVMKIKNEVVYFIETPDGSPVKNIEGAVKALGIAEGKVVLTKIPRDPRHFSKIDYGSLLKQYNKI